MAKRSVGRPVLMAGLAGSVLMFTSLQNIQDFGFTMGMVKETRVDSVGVPEDMFSGISDAIEKTAWTPGAARILILVADAPGHELGHRRNVSGLDEITARALATRNNITLMAIQIRPPGQERHHRVAERQFRALAFNPGTDTPAFYSVDSRDMQVFAQITEMMVSSLRNIVYVAQQGNLAQALASGTNLTGNVAAENEGTNQALRAALVQWVGSHAEARPPRDVVAWVTDKDLGKR